MCTLLAQTLAIAFRHLLRGSVLGALVSVGYHGIAQAIPILDQNQPTFDANQVFAGWTASPPFLTPVDLAQSFRTPNTNVAGAGVLFHPGIPLAGTIIFQGQASVTISLYDALPNAGGNLLASATVMGTSSLPNASFADVFWSPVGVTPNTDLFLVFTTPQIPPVGDPALAGNSANPYPNGQFFANAGFNPFPTADIGFRTYTDPEFTGPPPDMMVPEPTTLALIGLGLAGLGFVRRRRLHG